MLRWIIPFIVATSCGTASIAGVTQIDKPGPFRPLKSAEQQLIQNSVKDELLDPDSAKFRMGPLTLAAWSYFGVVNSKNRMGGYTGFWTFRVDIKKDGNGRIIAADNVYVMSDDMPLYQRRPALTCYKEGYPSTWTN
jgi:hypothetical protein